MAQMQCPHCYFPKVRMGSGRPRRGQGTVLLMGASGPVTLGLSWALLLYWWARGDFGPSAVYRCQTCGHEWHVPETARAALRVE
jgi:hypothetical protein